MPLNMKEIELIIKCLKKGMDSNETIIRMKFTNNKVQLHNYNEENKEIIKLLKKLKLGSS